MRHSFDRLCVSQGAHQAGSGAGVSRGAAHSASLQYSENLPLALHHATQAVKINTDESPDTASKYGVRSIPTVMIFKVRTRQQDSKQLLLLLVLPVL